VTRYTLRPGTGADLEFILDVHARSMRPHVERQLGGWDAEAQRARILASTRPQTHQIVEVGGTPVGCAWIREHSGELELVRLWLLPAWQGKGIGTALLADLCARADREQLPLRLRVLRVNPARRLYARSGFGAVQETATHFIMRRPPSGAGRTRVRVGIAGEFDAGSVTHAATRAALAHAGAALGLDVEARWLGRGGHADVEKVDALLAGPGNPDMQGALAALRLARQRRIPVLGTCAGFQYLVIEFARGVLGLEDADHAEWNPQASRLLVSPLACSLAGQRAEVELLADSLAHAAYGATRVSEEYRCSYGLDPEYEPALERAGLRVTGRDREGAARAVELRGHPFHVGTLYVPQLSSSPERPHPLVLAFLRATRQELRRDG
jgi:GNAT superfamily N-acetyltransferase